MAKSSFVVARRHGAFAFHRRYPLDVAHHFSRPFRWEPLDAHSLTEAKQLALEKAVAFDREMRDLRIKDGLANGRTLREADIQGLASRFAACALHTDEIEREEGLSESEWEAYGALIERALKDGKKALARGDAAYAAESTSGILECEGYDTPGADLLRKLCFAVLKADIGALTEINKRHQGEVVDTPPFPAAPGVRTGKGLHGEAGYFEQILEGWSKAVKPGKKSLYEAQATLAEFVALCGANTHVIPWSGNKPRQHPGAEDLPRLHLADVGRADAMRFKHKLLEQNSVPTVKKKLGLLRAMTSVALHEQKDDASLPQNPFQDMWAKAELKKRGSLKPRVSFNIEQLQRIFDSPIFIDSKCLEPLCESAGGEAAYWLWLVGIFSGARLEELGQLTADCFEKVNGRWVFYVRVGKTPNARRIVPVHLTLEALGFIDYVRQYEGRIFPDLLPDCKGALTGNFSKWANRYLRTVIGIKDRRLVFHSARHSVKHILRGAGVSKEVSNYLAGHSRHDVSDDYGDDDFPMEPLFEAIDKLSYKGLDLSRLKRWVPKEGAR